MTSAVIGNHGEIPMWPSEELASRTYNIANIGLIVGLVIGVVCTVLVVWMGNVKESYSSNRLGAAEIEAGNANAAAAEANKQAESLRRENLVLQENVLKLQARTEYRHLTPLQQKAVADKVRKYSGIAFSIVVYWPESDSSALKDDVVGALTNAGWALKGQTGVGASAPEAGVVVEVNTVAKPESHQAAEELAKVLRSEGLFVPPVRTARPSKYLMGENPGSRSDGEIRISIGRRP